MKFILYCDHNPRDLGIEDKDGNWNYDRFREHIEVCPDCSRFKDLLDGYLLDNLGKAFDREPLKATEA
ncbi:unnamed protein product [marine sediment metagenome]|uniref:Uncharacterized protein n=1 Tax=marine sediment metagenome TaxID=412755 RepID=X1RMK0_9ZZZZ